MLQAIKELGELRLKLEGRDISDLLSILVQNPNQTKRYPLVFVIVFSSEGNKLSYSHILTEEASESKSKKYLYRRAASQGPNYTPTCITSRDFQTTLKNRIEGWFKKIKETRKGVTAFEFKTEEESIEVPINAPIIKKLIEAFNTNKDKIFQELSDKWNEVQPYLKREGGTGVILTIGFADIGGGIKYIGDFPEFQKFLLDIKLLKLREIRKDKHTCSICDTYTEVYGNSIADYFKFYTLDKPGYIAGGFQKLDAWKNFPLCLNCALKIEEGKDFLDDYLQFSMGGNKYYLIPKFILGTEKAKDIINDFFTIVTQPKDTLANVKRISADEKEILEELGKFQDLLTYNFMFFDRQKGASSVHRINLLVEDVLPSRLSAIFEAKKEAEKPEIFKDLKVKKGKYENVEFRFDVFRKFAPTREAFLEVIDKTFRGINLDQSIIFSWLMIPIRQSFVDDLYLKLVLRALVTFLFFKKLEILPRDKYFAKGGQLMNELKIKAEGFFEKFSETYPTPAHKAVFLLGALAQKLLNIQYQERNATPFRKNLKGLRMKEEDFKVLLPKIQNKLEEYGKNYYRSLESLISEYFLEAGKGWRISTDELNFYFVLGMNLVEEIDKALGLTEEKEGKDD